jgi:hypothetical protein
MSESDLYGLATFIPDIFSSLSDFHRKYACDKAPNFVSPAFKRRFFVHRLTVNDFWVEYDILPLPKSVAEIQAKGFASILVDYDSYSAKPLREDAMRQVITRTGAVLADIIRSDLVISTARRSDRAVIPMIVFRKPERIIDEGDHSGQYKFGFHLQLLEHMATQPVRERVIKKLKEAIPEVDGGSAHVPWLLNASTKDVKGTSVPYLPHEVLYISIDGSVRGGEVMEYLSSLFGRTVDKSNLSRHLSVHPYLDNLEPTDHWTTRVTYFEDSEPGAAPSTVKKRHSDADGAVSRAVEENAGTISAKVESHLNKLHMLDDFFFDVEDVDNGFVKLKRLAPGRCPVDGHHEHDRLGGWITCNGKSILLGCYSDRCKGNIKRFMLKPIKKAPQSKLDIDLAIALS